MSDYLIGTFLSYIFKRILEKICPFDAFKHGKYGENGEVLCWWWFQ